MSSQQRTHDSAITRRDFLTAAASAAVAAGSTSATAWSAPGSGGLRLPAQGGRGSSWNGVRFDADRSALLLVGEPGSFASEGAYTTAPIALSPGERRHGVHGITSFTDLHASLRGTRHPQAALTCASSPPVRRVAARV